MLEAYVNCVVCKTVDKWKLCDSACLASLLISVTWPPLSLIQSYGFFKVSRLGPADGHLWPSGDPRLMSACPVVIPLTWNEKYSKH